MKILKWFRDKIWSIIDGGLGLLAVEIFRRFGGYGFSYGFVDEEKDSPYQLVMYARNRDIFREFINDGSGLSVDYSGSEARIKVNPDFVYESDDKEYPVYLGEKANWCTKIYVFGRTFDDIENGINKYFRVNPIGDEVVIEPPRGFEHLDPENFVEEEF